MSTNLPPDDASAPSPGPTPTGATGTAPGHEPGAEFFDKIRSVGLVRPDEGRWAAGVCAGIARRTGIDAVLVRGLFVVLAVFGGGALFLYGLAWLFLPHPDGRIHAQEVLRGVVTAGFVGAAAAVLLGLPFDATFDGGPGGAGWGWGFHPGGIGLLIGIGLVIWVIRSRNQHGPGGPGGAGGPGGPGGGGWHGPVPPAGGPTGTATGAPSAPYGPSSPGGPSAPSWGTPGVPPRGTGTEDAPSDRWATSGSAPTAVLNRPAPVPVPDVTRPSHALTRAVLGLAVVVAATIALVDMFAVAVPSVVAVSLAAALGIVALGILVAGATGRRSGGLAPIAWLLAILAANAATVSNLDLDRRDATWRPTSAAVAETGYDHGAGDVLVDLTDPALLTGATSGDPVDVKVDLGVGRLVVEVPRSTGVRVDGSVGLGQLDDRAGGSGSSDGSTTRTVTVGTGPTTLVVRAEVGLGQLVIVPEGTVVALAPTTATEAVR